MSCDCISKYMMTAHLLMCQDEQGEWSACICVCVCVLMHWLDRRKETKIGGQSERDQYFCGVLAVVVGLPLLFLSFVLHKKQNTFNKKMRKSIC